MQVANKQRLKDGELEEEQEGRADGFTFQLWGGLCAVPTFHGKADSVDIRGIMPTVQLMLIDDASMLGASRASVASRNVEFAFKIMPVTLPPDVDPAADPELAEAFAQDRAESVAGRPRSESMDSDEHPQLLLVEVYEGGKLVKAVLARYRFAEGWETRVREFCMQDMEARPGRPDRCGPTVAQPSRAARGWAPCPARRLCTSRHRPALFPSRSFPPILPSLPSLPPFLRPSLPPAPS